MNQEHAFCLAIERLLGITPPIRGQLIRVLYSEIGRVLSHFGGVSADPPYFVRVGASSSNSSPQPFHPRRGRHAKQLRIRPGGAGLGNGIKLIRSLPDARPGGATGPSKYPCNRRLHDQRGYGRRWASFVVQSLAAGEQIEFACGA